MTNKKYILGALIAVGVLVSVLFLTGIIGKKPNLILEKAPSPTKVVINGKEIKGTEANLKPGSYELVATFDGFNKDVQTFTIEEGKVTELIVLLNPNGRVGELYLAENPEEQFKREALGGKLSKKISRDLSNQNPIVDSLPFIDQLFRVDYGSATDKPNDPTAVTIHVKFYSEEGRQQAIEWLSFKGVDPNSEDVLYTDASGIPFE